ncbi:ATP-binding protein [Actinoplanes sp. NPDC051851]|uniref:ATP-binding protein n=1 Tax=Actinoplanes sp. NPDC051851 TaxID=3154753 RepID=UPI0034157181
MRHRTSLVRTGMFAALYVIATVAGRLTVMDRTNLSLVWPAAGVAVVWFSAQRRSGIPWADVAALSLITLVVNTATGATPVMAMIFVIANLVQVAVFLKLFERWRPALWGAGGDEPLRSPRDLWGLLGAAFGATLAGALIGPTGVWLAIGRYSWPATWVWLARNTAAVLLFGAVALSVGHAVKTARARHGGLRGASRYFLDRMAATPRWRIGEYVALGVCSTLAYLAGFAFSDGLPLAFLLIAVTVWAGTRVATPFVVLHDLAAGVITVVFTLNGMGPFAAIPDNAGRAFVAQLFVALVAVVGLVLALGRDERGALLAELAAEKAELAAQREEASRRAEMMTTIVDSMADGVAVIDSTGRVILRNPAAVQLLGGQASQDGTVAASDHYGFFHLDGQPVTDDELAHVRVRTGERVEGVDYVIRNAGVPEGRIVRVTASSFPDGDGRTAVVLFHDVTAERRHRDELANFAGVVAHDLLNPVTTVEGWSETAEESLDGVEGVEMARDSLVRVNRAAVRMRLLINGLLDYTTARDAQVAPAAIDLDAMVAEITVARLDAAVAGGNPRPRFTVGELPPVLADPVLVRQLLDNLIGNAIKYTAPGTVPALEITAKHDKDLVRVAIADNGIGIPAGQHDAIFDNFHRAHRTSGYAGTGLGLGICKRIVERHGGTIAAADNPGGGSLFTFTLPAAGAARQAVPTGRSTQLR